VVRNPCLLALLACGAPATPVHNAAPNGSCPGAADVYVVEHDDKEGWLLPLAGEELGSQEVEAGMRPLADASKLPAPPPKLWIYADGKTCEATPGAAYEQIIEEGPISATYGVRLVTTCDGKDMLDVAVAAPAKGCELVSPRGIGGRAGGESNDGGWSPPPPDEGADIPSEVAAVLPPHEACKPPCEPLWNVAEFEVGGKPMAWEVVREWVSGKPGDSACNWAQTGDKELYVSTPRGIVPLGIEGLHGFALLADGRGPQLLVATNLGEYAVYEVTPAPAQRKHVKYMWPNEEDYAGQDVLGPYCGP
jgi:hypothetical protein